jgi:large repetitive protein
VVRLALANQKPPAPPSRICAAVRSLGVIRNVNTATRPSRLSRWAAALISGALVIVASIVASSPAQAATGDVTGGTATWGISTYLNAGSFGRPSPLVSGYVAPAAYDATTKLSSWGDASGHVNADGSASLAFSGTSVNFTATGGGWLRLGDLQATLDSAGNGTVSALVAYGLAPGSYPNISYDPEQAPQRGPERVTLVTLAGNSAGATLSDTAASWSGLAGSWNPAILAYLQGDGATIAAWDYAATITNDGSVTPGPRTALPFSFAVSFEAAPKSYNAGTATWGISTYLNAGNFGRPSPLVSGYVAPAAYNPTTKMTTWGNATGTLYGDGSASLAYFGTSVNFTATGGGWLRIADPQVSLDPSGNGAVTALVSYGLAPGAYPNISYDPAQAPQRGPERVEIVTLAGNAIAPAEAGGTVSWSGLAGSWSTAMLAYLQGDGGSIAAWDYAATITNDGSVTPGPRTALPFSFTLSSAPLITTSTTLTASPATAPLAGTDVALTAAVSPATAGTVEFRSGSTVLASTPVSGGVASHTITAAAAGDYALSAVFTPTDAAHYAPSTGSLAYTVTAPVPAAPGSLTWGVKQSLQSYVLGGGSITTAKGAGYNGVRFSFPQASSRGFDHDSMTGSAAYGGSTTFAYPAHGFSIGLANPRVQLTSASAGTLYVDVTYNGGTTAGIAFATLGLAPATKSSTGSTTSFSNVSATLTAAGAAAFQGFYTAGTALDPMSFVIGAPSSGFAATTKAAPVNAPAATPPATEGITAGSQPAIEGGQFSATATGFGPNERDILVVIYSEPMLLDTVTANSSGTVSWEGELPTGLSGEHTLTFQGSVDRGIVLDIAPAAAGAADLCAVESADLTWGFKETFRSYISGAIANGEWTVADGATYETPSFGWSDGSGAIDPAAGAGELSFAGSITFTGHGGILNTTVANPVIVITDADTAVLRLDVSGTTQQGDEVSQTGVEFVELDLAAATVDTSDDGTVTIANAPATLTEEGSAAFGTYEAGEAFDPVTLTFTVGADCALPIAEPTTPLPAADEQPDLGWLWLIPVLLIAAIIAVIVRRRQGA